MDKGRGSAVVLVFITILVTVMTVDAAVYTVGDAAGWTFSISKWPARRPFRQGDVLVFKYNSAFHNVVAVSEAGYKTCTAPSGSKVWRSGNDRIILKRGINYFICSIPGHCSADMKVAVTAI